jgi:two-component system chemotaxis sensor kinase CheA
LLSYLSYNGAKESVIILIDKLAEDSANSVKSHLNQLLDKPHIITQINADAMKNGQITVEALFAKPEVYFFAQHKQFPTIDETYLGRNDGAFASINKADNNYTLKVTTAFPARDFISLDENSTRTNIFKTNNFDATTRIWYKKAIEKNSSIWSDIYVFSGNSKLGITAAQPAYDTTGKFIGVFGVDLSLHSISEYLEKTKISENATTYIIDRNGMLIASSTNQKLYIDINSTDKKRLNAENAENSVISKSFNELKTQLKSFADIPYDNAYNISIDGVNYIVKISNYKDNHGLDWLIVTAVDKMDFMGDVYSLINKIAVLSIIVLFLVLATAFYIAGKIASPVEILSLKAKDVADGNFGESLHIKSISNEIDALIAAFNSMSAQLKHYFTGLNELNEELEHKVEDRTKQVKTLLDNANQGFLAFSSDMLIHNEYSEKCVEIFNSDIAGKDISRLLFEDETQRFKFKDTLTSLLDSSDVVQIEAILSLLQNEFYIADKIVSAEYKMVNEDDFMIILTDITEKKALEKRLERERKTLKMVVSSVANTSEFFELVSEYKEFLQIRTSLVDTSKTPLYNLTELYRTVHTYKGNFAQKDFITTPQGLHKLETRLSKFLADPNTTNEAVIAVLKKVELEAWLDKDLLLLKQTLGENFFDDESKITISEETLNGFKSKIKENAINLGLQESAINEIMEEVETLKLKSLYDALSSFPKIVEQVSVKLGKSVYPMHIECDKKIYISDEYKPFIRTLVHIFRNSVDHGLEFPDDRAEIGKDEVGTITCVASLDKNSNIQIVIADDGAGVNIKRVSKKAIENGICTEADIAKMSNEEIAMLIFSDNFSTKEEISELSGRGVGLAAVKAELENIGGHMHISTQQNKGATFAFYIPYYQTREGK